MATMQTVVEPSMRATAGAVYLFFGMLLGAGGAPFVIGVLSDMLHKSFGEAGGLRIALAGMISVTSVWALVHLVLALRHYGVELKSVG